MKEQRWKSKNRECDEIKEFKEDIVGVGANLLNIINHPKLIKKLVTTNSVRAERKISEILTQLVFSSLWGNFSDRESLKK